MSAISTPPLAIVEEGIPNAGSAAATQRTTKIRGVRAGFWVYVGLGRRRRLGDLPLLLVVPDRLGRRLDDQRPEHVVAARAATSSPTPCRSSTTRPSTSGSRCGTRSSARRVIAASVVVFSTLAGWAFAKLRFRGGKWLLAFVVATMAVPMQLGVVPLYILFADLGWTGKIGAIIVPALTSAFGVFWMTQYLSQTVPDELIEAARVDGASMLRTFWTVGVVAARPAAAMLFLFTFVGAWNQFFWPFIVLDRQSPTLPVALSLLQSNYFVDYSIVLAGVLLATIPLLHPVRLRRQAARQRHHGRRGQGLTHDHRDQRGPLPACRETAARAVPAELPLRSRHRRVPDRGRRPRGRAPRLDLGRVQPGSRRRDQRRQRRRRVRPLPPLPRRRRAHEVDGAADLPLLDVVVARASRRRRAQPRRASTSTSASSTSCWMPASCRG